MIGTPHSGHGMVECAVLTGTLAAPRRSAHNVAVEGERHIEIVGGNCQIEGITGYVSFFSG